MCTDIASGFIAADSSLFDDSFTVASLMTMQLKALPLWTQLFFVAGQGQGGESAIFPVAIVVLSNDVSLVLCEASEVLAKYLMKFVGTAGACTTKMYTMYPWCTKYTAQISVVHIHVLHCTREP